MSPPQPAKPSTTFMTAVSRQFYTINIRQKVILFGFMKRSDKCMIEPVLQQVRYDTEIKTHKIWQRKQRQKNLWPEKIPLPQPRLYGTIGVPFIPAEYSKW